MIQTGVFLILLLPISALAAFQGEYCEPQNESFYLQSDKKITPHSNQTKITFNRSEINGDETSVILEEGRDYELSAVSITNEVSNEQRDTCADGHQAVSTSGAADLEAVVLFQDESVLSKELKKITKNGKTKINVSCQWSAEEKPCAENR